MKLFLFIILCFSVSIRSSAQADTAISLSAYTVTGISETREKNTALNIHSYKLARLESKGPYNLSDALSRQPGVSQMNTGNAISKPVVRGLYGNRLLVLLSGLRFDNQQWQDEHGLGLSQIGIDRVELIKGPASLLYGTDAIGGVINVIEETPVMEGLVADINTRLYSNTLGTLTDIGLASLHGRSWWRVRGGIESQADYKDGDNIRILNSRNQGYYFKAGFGFQKGSWVQNNAYNFSYNQFGFIMDKLSYFDEDSRWARDMKGPHHNVMFNTFSSQNTFLLRSSTLKINAGIQSNKRAEDEGGGAISLNMHLLSLLENARWEKPLSTRTIFIVNQQFTFENNTNYGKRVLVPDAHMVEGNISGFIRYIRAQVTLETGIGYSFKQISTFRTHGLKSDPFSVFSPAPNIMAGISYNPNSLVNIKANIATGYRAPNLAELSSNGIHEGTYRYEVGDKNLKAEQNINADLSIGLLTGSWDVSASVYYNHFRNYIYQVPTRDSFLFIYPVYDFVQHDAHLYGGELSLGYTPVFVRHISVQEVLSVTNGVLDEGGHLPFIPPYRSITSLKFEKKGQASVINAFYVEPAVECVFSQDHPALFETSTPGHTLLNLNGGLTRRSGVSEFRLNLSVRNLTNVNYFDHLSRLKDYGYHNQGTNFILSLSYCPRAYPERALDKE